MDYEWAPRKAAENLRKHNVDFADAVIALEDENALTIEDPDHDEQRFKTLGMGFSSGYFGPKSGQERNQTVFPGVEP
ncbi:MAG: hypothetical protein BMS9Abin33_0329 [Gammaproteobacteria bacterium]|jgi:uncharacterized DUF497 family protein|nr:MAG: hypothetical protein BMS9Abin33_0329 [Gammaproteobacteria bacterium]